MFRFSGAERSNNTRVVEAASFELELAGWKIPRSSHFSIRVIGVDAERKSLEEVAS